MAGTNRPIKSKKFYRFSPKIGSERRIFALFRDVNRKISRCARPINRLSTNQQLRHRYRFHQKVYCEIKYLHAHHRTWYAHKSLLYSSKWWVNRWRRERRLEQIFKDKLNMRFLAIFFGKFTWGIPVLKNRSKNRKKNFHEIIFLKFS